MPSLPLFSQHMKDVMAKKAAQELGGGGGAAMDGPGMVIKDL